MAGGKGERFWPQSRLRRPKHLLPIIGEKPMLVQTLDRLQGLVPPERILIITNAEQADAVREICPQLPAANIIAEPVGRDTAAAVGLATVLVRQRSPEATFAMLPADHVIHDTAGFQAIVAAAFSAAEQEDALVTVGIRPSYAATGYGYIQRGAQAGTAEGRPVYAVQQFKEKPDGATAQTYVDSGSYYWNAGMFFWRVPVIADCFAKLTPELWAALGTISQGLASGQPLANLLQAHYPSLQKISVDYAIMEKAPKVRVIESAFDWDDVGEWPAVARHHEADAQGNVTRGGGLVHSGAGNIVISPGDHLVALVGVDDLIVVQTPDATLICPKSKAQDIKKLVQELAQQPRWKGLL